MTFIKTLPVEELWDGEMRGVVVGQAKVLLINYDGTFYAYEDRCPHLGVKLSQGILKGERLTCAAHQWEYNACTGCGINPSSARLRRFALRVEDGSLWIDPDQSEEAGNDA